MSGDGGRAGDSSAPQSSTSVTCQKCGRVSTPTPAMKDGWLVSRWRVDPRLWVIRCPSCITDHALRSSAAGRTKEWREKMRKGRERNLPKPNVLSQPVMIEDTGDDRLPDLTDAEVEEWFGEH